MDAWMNASMGACMPEGPLVGAYLTEVAKALNLLPLPFNLTKVSSMFWLLGACWNMRCHPSVSIARI